MKLDSKTRIFFELLKAGFGEKEVQLGGTKDSDYEKVFQLAKEQTITGLFMSSLEKNLLPPPPKELLLQVIGNSLMIHQQNQVLDKAVVELCILLETIHSRFIIVKGQTLAALYGDKGTRQSGDIDFCVHPDDWEKTYQLCRDAFKIKNVDTHSEKHIEWEYGGVLYEMHRILNDFANKKHQQYWDDVIMEEAWQHPWAVTINGFDVPTLAPTYYAIYVFVHLFFHLISEGVGLRQFMDWGVVLEKGDEDIDRHLLRMHLEGIGLLKAYTGLGAVLTDYLGFPVDRFPFVISKRDHKGAGKLMENILQSGNFGHNIRFLQKHGVLHGLQQMWRRLGQIISFGYYAPEESCGMITKTVCWWGKKLKRMICQQKLLI